MTSTILSRRRCPQSRAGWLVPAVAAALALTAAGCGSDDETTSLTVAIQANWPPINTARLADEFDFYADENLEIEFLTVSSAPDAVTGLLGGSVDIIVTATDFMIPVVRGEADLVTVASTLNVAPFDLVTASEITGRAQLANATIGVNNEQGVSTVAFYQQMEDAGVDVSGIEMVIAGSTNERYNSLSVGQVDATSVGPPFGFLAEEEGFNNLGLAEGGGLPRPLVTAAVTVDRSWVESEEGEESVVAFLRALQGFTDFAYENDNLQALTEATARVMELDDERYAELAWEWIWDLELLPRNLEVDPEGMLTYLEGFVEIGGELPVDVPDDASPFYDHTYLHAAQESLQ